MNSENKSIENLGFILITFLFFLFMSSCSFKNNDQIGSKSIDEANLKSFTLSPIDSVELDILKYHDARALNDTLLLIIDLNSNNIFKIYNLNNLSQLMTFGTKGKGPNEFDNPRITGQYEFKNDSLFIYLVDLSLKKFVRVGIDPTKSNSQNFRHDLIFVTHPELILGMRDLFYDISDRVLYGTIASYKGPLFKWQIDSEHPIFYQLPFKLKNDLDKHLLGYFHESVMALNLAENKLVTAMFLFKRFDFYNLAADHKASYLLNSLDPVPDTEKIVEEGTTLYFTKSYSTKNYFYFMSTEDIHFGPEKNNIIYKGNWSGGNLEKYYFDRPLWTTFAVNEHQQYYYSIAENDESGNFYLIKYEIF